jgi:hypothetical protein
MKSNVILMFALAASLVACAPKKDKEVTSDLVDITASGGGTAPAGKSPAMKFDRDKHDFGKITQGDRVTTQFKFKNIGGSDLIISDARGSCGCTVPDYPKKPIAPGEEGVINVEFNSEGKRDKQEKTVTLTTNCEPNTVVLTIAAEILVPEGRESKEDGHFPGDGHNH